MNRTMKISEYNNAKRRFDDYFKVPITKFYEPLFSVAAQKLTIDILLFDEWLQVKHGNYEGTGLSLKDVVIANYGEDAYNFLKEIDL